MSLPVELDKELKRIAKLLERVIAPLKEVEKKNPHQVETLSCLGSEALIAYRSVLNAWVENEFNSLQYSAFACRNVLEILVWTLYCAGSDANMARFREDAVRDKNGILKALEALASVASKKYGLLWPPLTETPAGTPLYDFEKLVNQLSIDVGIGERDIGFKKVAEAAKELNVEVFPGLYKLLSKYAHPTAANIYSLYAPSQPITDLKGVFCAWATIFMLNIIKLLKEAAERLFGHAIQIDLEDLSV